MCKAFQKIILVLNASSKPVCRKKKTDDVSDLRTNFWSVNYAGQFLYGIAYKKYVNFIKTLLKHFGQWK